MEKGQARSVSTFNNDLRLKGFNAFQIDDDSHVTRFYSRKGFYKICLTTGKSIIHYSVLFPYRVSAWWRSRSSLFAEKIWPW
jgi:hypothetical protein